MSQEASTPEHRQLWTCLGSSAGSASSALLAVASGSGVGGACLAAGTRTYEPPPTGGCYQMALPHRWWVTYTTFGAEQPRRGSSRCRPHRPCRQPRSTARVLQVSLLRSVIAMANATTASVLHPHPYLGGLSPRPCFPRPSFVRCTRKPRERGSPPPCPCPGPPEIVGSLAGPRRVASTHIAVLARLDALILRIPGGGSRAGRTSGAEMAHVSDGGTDEPRHRYDHDREQYPRGETLPDGRVIE